MNSDGSPEVSATVDFKQSKTSGQNEQPFKLPSAMCGWWRGSILMTYVPAHLFIWMVVLTATLVGALAKTLLEHREHVGHCLHHHLVKGAGDQIVHETDEATGPRSVGLITLQSFLFIMAFSSSKIWICITITHRASCNLITFTNHVAYIDMVELFNA